MCIRDSYRDLGDFITDLDKAIANPAGRNAASIPPPPSSPAIPALNVQKGQSNIYYYLIPALIVGIVADMSTLVIPSDMRYASALAILILVLLIRPQGIFGKQKRVG